MMAAAWLAKATANETERAGYLADAFQFFTAGGGRWDISPCEPTFNGLNVLERQQSSAGSSGLTAGGQAAARAAAGRLGGAPCSDVGARSPPGCSPPAHADVLRLPHPRLPACRHLLGRVLPRGRGAAAGVSGWQWCRCWASTRPFPPPRPSLRRRPRSWPAACPSTAVPSRALLCSVAKKIGMDKVPGAAEYQVGARGASA